VSEVSGRGFGDRERKASQPGKLSREARGGPTRGKRKYKEGLADDAIASFKVTVGKFGRVTLPASVRDELELDEGSELNVQVVAEKLVLTPVVTVPRGYGWAYEREHRERLNRALADVEEGRVRPLDEEELLRVLRS
jgi:AbrB family looped-hinge helix DNA binding protein